MQFYYQKKGGNESWVAALAAARDHVLSTKSPQFVTVLDVSQEPEGLTAEEMHALKYMGPLYFDFDHADREFCIQKFQEFLVKLEKKEVKLSSLRLYASGGKGFHIEVPIEIFYDGKTKDGIQNLPLIYKEIAYELFVDSLDMRVYSAKRGRMWRTPNVQRENGAYKVPISLAEAKSMTPEKYTELTSQPRVYISPEVYDPGQIDQVPMPSTPEFSYDLALSYATALTKVQEGVKRRKKSKKDLELIKKYGGKFPESVKALLNGEGLNMERGWNQVCMQVAILANAMGMEHVQVIEEAQPLIQGYSGDSDRYASASQRQRELETQLAYTKDNVCYTYSIGGIKSLLADGVHAPDLEGLTSKQAIEDAKQTRADVENLEEDETFIGGISVGKSGIRQKNAEGNWMQLSAVGLDNVALQLQVDAQRDVGIRASFYYRGKFKGRHFISTEAFTSSSKLSSTLSSLTGGMFQGSDAAARYVWEALMVKIQNMKDGSGVEYLMRREGLDIVQFDALEDVPEAANKPFLVYSTFRGCVLPRHIQETGMVFSFQGDPNPLGEARSDLLGAPNLEDVPNVKETIENLLQLNQPDRIGPMIGWFTAAHARMLYHLFFEQFPLLGLAGVAGSGKTTTAHLLSNLHYALGRMKETHLLGSTTYGITTSVQSSTSIPIALEEYKLRDMRPEKRGDVQAMMRAAYNNGTISKGGGSGGALSSGREIMTKSYSAPLIYFTEVQETQPAIVERTLPVTLRAQDTKKRADHLYYVRDNHLVLGAIGKRIVDMLLQTDLDDFRKSFEAEREIAWQFMGRDTNFRVLHNYTVAAHGLWLFSEALKTAGYDMFDKDLADMREAIYSVDKVAAPLVRSEASQVLSMLSLMSKMDSLPDQVRLVKGKDYTFSAEGDSEALVLNPSYCFTKYQAFCRNQGTSALYSNLEQFTIGMRTHPAFFMNSAGELSDGEETIKMHQGRLDAENVEPLKK